MNFLQLCQRAIIECGVASNQAATVVLPTVVGASGSVGRIVNWINDAWTDIQMDHDDWDWMRSSNILGQGVSFQTVWGRASYPLGVNPGNVGVDVDSFGKWDRETLRCFTTATSIPIYRLDGFGNIRVDGFGNPMILSATGGPYGQDEMFLDEIPFDAWRDGYMLGAMRSVRTRPVVVAVGPDQSLNLGPPPNSLYTITGDYFMAASEMVDDDDVPLGLPTRFHMLIVYRTMMKYGGYESAPEVYQRGSEENGGMYAQLQAVRAPRFTWGGALA